ncbi:9091_t:CDS:2, partial [Gigaspora margarita]
MNFVLIFTFLVLISSSNSAWLDRRSESYECINVTSDIFKPLEPLSPTDGPVTRCYNLELVLTDLAPDGFTRPVWTANGQYPGPILQANHGDRMIVNVFNKFGDPATRITQCAIPNDDKFTYNFTIKQNGTYWYHSHHLGQMIDGLKGPLIIYNPKDPYLGKYDFEYVMTLSDWYHAPTNILLPIFSSDSYRGFAPVPDSGEISGLGQYDCKAAPKNSTCNPNNKIATYVVKKGKKYRFRIINTSALVHYILSIDNHPLTIIEVDAIDNKTLNFDSAINYDVTGILKYDGAKDKSPTSTPYPLNTSEECRDVNPNFLKPYVEQKVPQNVIATFKALVNFGAAASGRGIALINNSSFVPSDNYPTNQKIVDGIKPDELSNTDNPYTYECDSGDCDDAAVEIFIINNTTDSHPFHVHGHDFFVLYNGENNSDIKSPQKSEFNFKDPVIRDVVTVLPNSTTVILYSANNPGVWLFHCHIQWHLSMGMAAQLIESPSIFKNTTIPSDVTALCAKDRG